MAALRVIRALYRTLQKSEIAAGYAPSMVSEPDPLAWPYCDAV
jgi:hypothetical protein